jgi:hypothetical protein
MPSVYTLLQEIHSSTGVESGDWSGFRHRVTGYYLVSGTTTKELEASHLIREYNNQVNLRYKAWTGASPVTTGLFIEPYDDGFRYLGTGGFRDYP